MKNLLAEFPPVSTADWESAIIADLKGGDYQKKLVWKTWEDIAVKPYYRAEDLSNLQWLLQNLPGEFPYARGSRVASNSWEVRAQIFESCVEQANVSARRNVERGADGLAFRTVIRQGKVLGQNVQSQEDFSRLLAGVDLSKVAIHLDWGLRGAQALAMLSNYAEKNGGLSQVNGSLAFDPYAELAAQGSIPLDKSELSAAIAQIATYAQKNLPKVMPLVVQGHVWHNAGANAVQELGIALATGAAYMDALTEAGVSANQAARLIGFSLSVGSNYFFEIAKVRSLRVLWASVLSAYGVNDVPATIHCRTSEWAATVFDPPVNILRGTTEAMSAVLAGCNALTVLPYDALFRCPDEFSYRIARNTQLILKSETGFDRLVDPSGGSYYIESVTNELASRGLAHFQSIEAKGGILQALQNGDLQKELSALLSKRIKAVEQRRETVLGVNAFPNLTEKMTERIQSPVAVPLQGPIQDCACSKVEDFRKVFVGEKKAGCVKQTGSINAQPLRLERGAEVFERIRLATEASATRKGSAPKVFLWTAGNLAMRLARATFVKNFFACAGYDIIDSNGIPSAAAGLEILQKVQPNIVVLCSADDEYLALAKEVLPVVEKVFPNAHRVIAGYPESLLEELKAVGAQDFIHVRTNAAETLAAYNTKLGVN